MKTKKLILVIFLTFIGAIGAYAQKTNVRMQETQARLLDVTSNAYVKPLTVELQIDKSKGRIKDEWTLTREQAEQEMNGDLVNIRSYAIYMSSQKHNADVIVAATFNVKTNDDGNGYKVTVIGLSGHLYQLEDGRSLGLRMDPYGKNSHNSRQRQDSRRHQITTVIK